MDKSSLDNLAHIANISEDLQSRSSNQKRENSHQFVSRNDLSHPPETDHKKTRRLACTCCRQQKSKCDAQTRYPSPCTRCTNKGLPCELNAGFKRTEKRARLALIEREFAELKKSFQSPLGALEIARTAPNLLANSFAVPQLPLLPIPLSQPLSLSRHTTPHSFSPSLLDRIPNPNPDRLQGQVFPVDGVNHSDLVKNHLISPQPSNARPPTSTTISQPKALVPQPSTTVDMLPSTSISEDALLCEEKILEDVALSPQTIRSLYLEYVHQYHPILPIVDITRGPERIYRLCPSLFWVIIYVTLRRYSDDKTLLVKLSPLVKNILAEITISPIARYNPTEEDEPIMNSCSVYSVQAFVLYSMWPPLTSSLSADSSWSTIGVALYQAIRIGLHTSAQLLEQYKGVEEHELQYLMAQEQMKTWILCNTVSQNIASAFGYPAFVQFEFASAQHCKLSTFSRHLMEIAQFEDQVCKTLNLSTFGATSQSNERLALFKVLGNQLDELELKLISECSQENGFRKFLFILARIHLLSNYFLDSENMSSFELYKGLVRLYNTSTSLIEHVQMCQAKSNSFVEYLPAVSVLSIWQASFFIVKLANSPMKSIIDVSIARDTFSVAVDLVAKASILKHDIAYRGSGIMRNVWHFFRRLSEQNLVSLSISIKSRMSASVFFDCLSLLRDKVGLAKLNIKTDMRGNSESNEDELASSEEENENHRTEETSAASDDEHNSAHVNSDRTGQGGSQRSTPGSFNSSGRPRKKRTLSDADDTESTARRIIRTIPLDPQPISATKRSTIFKVVNGSNHTSPNSTVSSSSVKAEDNGDISRSNTKENGTMTQTESQIPNQISSLMSNPISNLFSKLLSNLILNQTNNMKQAPSNQIQSVINNNAFSVPSFAVNSDQVLSGLRNQAPGFDDLSLLLEQDLFENNDLLWKDVDSLMNDFGFHA